MSGGQLSGGQLSGGQLSGGQLSGVNCRGSIVAVPAQSQQRDINILYFWSLNNKMKFHPDKCKVVSSDYQT